MPFSSAIATVLSVSSTPEAPSELLPKPMTLICSSPCGNFRYSIFLCSSNFMRVNPAPNSRQPEPPAVSRPSLFSNLLCTRGKESLQKSAAGGKRRHDAAPISRPSSCLNLPCPRGKCLLKRAQPEASDLRESVQPRFAVAKYANCWRVQPAALVVRFRYSFCLLEGYKPGAI